MKQTARRHAIEERSEVDREGQTPLGKRLRALRKKLIATGEPLLDWDGIEEEIANRRGEP